jgi:hypothetical protein
MNWRDYFGRDGSLSDEEASRRFKRRHGLGLWCGVLPLFGFFAAGLLFIKLDGNLLAFACGWFLGLTLLVYIGAVYRCPRCGTVPSSSVPGTSGVLLFPKKCPKCKAPLLPNHRWAQD